MDQSDIKKYGALTEPIAAVEDALLGLPIKLKAVLDGGVDSLATLAATPGLDVNLAAMVQRHLAALKAMQPDLKEMGKRFEALVAEKPAQTPQKYPDLPSLGAAHGKLFAAYLGVVKAGDEVAQAGRDKKTCPYAFQPPTNPLKNASMLLVCDKVHTIWRSYYIFAPVLGRA
jgi:hypothetical protein